MKYLVTFRSHRVRSIEPQQLVSVELYKRIQKQLPARYFSETDFNYRRRVLAEATGKGLYSVKDWEMVEDDYIVEET